MAISDDSSGRLTDAISLGVLAEVIGRDVIEDALDETWQREQRCRLLPAHVMVRYCIAMCLFYENSYKEVTRKLVGSLRHMGQWQDEWHVPTTSAITQARKRLTSEPLRSLFDRVAVPVADRGAPGAWLGARRLMAIDGFMLDVPDSDTNVAEFGRLTTGAKASAYPQVRVLALSECGTHANIAASFGPCRTDERVLVKDTLDAFEPGMLVLADRNFYSYGLWQQALDTSADLLWRAKSDLTLPVLQALPDGSYRSVVINPKISGARRATLLDRIRRGDTVSKQSAIPVRVVEYNIPDRKGNGTGELICLITSILDPTEATAEELATTYHERWECETCFGEVKTRLRGSGRVLRSKSPNMVRQEIWALLLTHYAIRKLMYRAAVKAAYDPDRLSFQAAIHAIRRQIPLQADLNIARRIAALHEAFDEMLEDPNERRDRTCPRVVKRARHNSYPVKRDTDVSTTHDGPPTIHLHRVA